MRQIETIKKNGGWRQVNPRDKPCKWRPLLPPEPDIESLGPGAAEPWPPAGEESLPRESEPPRGLVVLLTLTLGTAKSSTQATK